MKMTLSELQAEFVFLSALSPSFWTVWEFLGSFPVRNRDYYGDVIFQGRTEAIGVTVSVLQRECDMTKRNEIPRQLFTVHITSNGSYPLTEKWLCVSLLSKKQSGSQKMAK